MWLLNVNYSIFMAFYSRYLLNRNLICILLQLNYWKNNIIRTSIGIIYFVYFTHKE